MWKLLFELISYLNNKNKTKIDNQLISDQFNELEQGFIFEYLIWELLTD